VIPTYRPLPKFDPNFKACNECGVVVYMPLKYKHDQSHQKKESL
jgi:hypothetical protein